MPAEQINNHISPEDQLINTIHTYQGFPDSSSVPMDFWREPLSIWESLSSEESLEESQRDFLADLFKKDPSLFHNFLQMMLGESLREHNVRLQNIYKSPIFEKALSIEGSEPIFMQKNEQGVRNWINLLIRMNTHEGNDPGNSKCIIFREGRAVGRLIKIIKDQFYPEKSDEEKWENDLNIFHTLRE